MKKIIVVLCVSIFSMNAFAGEPKCILPPCQPCNYDVAGKKVAQAVCHKNYKHSRLGPIRYVKKVLNETNCVVRRSVGIKLYTDEISKVCNDLERAETQAKDQRFIF